MSYCVFLYILTIFYFCNSANYRFMIVRENNCRGRVPGRGGGGGRAPAHRGRPGNAEARATPIGTSRLRDAVIPGSGKGSLPGLRVGDAGPIPSPASAYGRLTDKRREFSRGRTGCPALWQAPDHAAYNMQLARQAQRARAPGKVGDTARSMGRTRFWSRSDGSPHDRARSRRGGRPDQTARDHEGGQQHHAPHQCGDHDRA